MTFVAVEVGEGVLAVELEAAFVVAPPAKTAEVASNTPFHLTVILVNGMACKIRYGRHQRRHSIPIPASTGLETMPCVLSKGSTARKRTTTWLLSRLRYPLYSRTMMLSARAISQCIMVVLAPIESPLSNFLLRPPPRSRTWVSFIALST